MTERERLRVLLLRGGVEERLLLGVGDLVLDFDLDLDLETDFDDLLSLLSERLFSSESRDLY